MTKYEDFRNAMNAFRDAQKKYDDANRSLFKKNLISNSKLWDSIVFFNDFIQIHDMEKAEMRVVDAVALIEVVAELNGMNEHERIALAIFIGGSTSRQKK